MSSFPGIALIIDDQFAFTNQPEVEDIGLKTQQASLKDLKEFFENNFIPFVTITDTNDVGKVINSIKSYSNVRLISLDLDLNNDGFVNEEDDFLLINQILVNAAKTYGYFFLLINSAHSEKWEDIKNQLPEEVDFFKNKNSLVECFNKNERNAADKLLELQIKNYSLELIYDFEVALNKARDKSFGGLIDTEKRTWNKIFKQIESEAGDFASYSINEILLSNLKQHLLSIKYSIPENDDPIDENIIKIAFQNANYIDILGLKIDEKTVWTGNLYFIENAVIENFNYALIINPECDIAQKKILNNLIVYGYEANETTFPKEYDHTKYKDSTPPTHPFRQGKSSKGWKDSDTLKKPSNFKEHFYTLPFASKDGKTIILDFREVSTIVCEDSEEIILVKRIIDPMMTDILDKFSLLFNRKGLPKILTDKTKLFEH